MRRSSPRFIRLLLVGVTVLLFLLPGCGDSETSEVSASDNSKLLVYAGLPPIAFLASRVGGEVATVGVSLPEGRSPHDYAPSPKDIKNAASSELFLTTRMAFEQALARPLRDGRTRIVDISTGVERIPFDGEAHHDHHAEPPRDHDPDGCAEDDGTDPHIWLSLANDRVIVANILATFCEARPDQTEAFQQNAQALIQELTALEAEIQTRLASYKGRAFYVYHPAFGYYASMTGLRQVAVEKGGREATSSHFAELVRQARTDGIRVVFVQPQFNPASIAALTKAIQAKAVELDPLAYNLIANLRRMTDALTAGTTQETGK